MAVTLPLHELEPAGAQPQRNQRGADADGDHECAGEQELRRRFQLLAALPSPELLAAGALVVAVCVGATVVPLRLSARRLELMEW
jgi:hypothetical protein